MVQEYRFIVLYFWNWDTSFICEIWQAPCGVILVLPLPALTHRVVYRHHSAGLLSRRDHVRTVASIAAEGFALCVCVRACVRACVGGWVGVCVFV